MSTTFNIDSQTTAGTSQAEAPTAVFAAATAASKGSALTGETSIIDQLGLEVQQNTDAAIIQGQHDFESAKAAGAAYLDQAKSMAGDALASAQSYLPGSVSGQNQPADSTTTGSLQSTAATVIGTTKQYINSAQAAIQPHINTVVAAAQPRVEQAKVAGQDYLGSGIHEAVTTAPPSEVPSTSAPRQSGPHPVGKPYPNPTARTK